MINQKINMRSIVALLSFLVFLSSCSVEGGQHVQGYVDAALAGDFSIAESHLCSAASMWFSKHRGELPRLLRSELDSLGFKTPPSVQYFRGTVDRASFRLTSGSLSVRIHTLPISGGGQFKTGKPCPVAGRIFS
jgi:hypothetical protein